MPQKKITFKPGVNQENTRYVTEGGWYDCDKVRFRQGFPEKIGGWAAISVYTFLGICRSLWNWTTLGGLNLFGVGTNLKFYIEDGGQYYDVTPLRNISASVAINNAFTTISASSQVQVTIAGINLFTGDIVNIYGISAAVNGIPAAAFNAQFSVTRIDSNNFYIQLPTNATSSGVSGGTGTLTYFSYYYPIQSIATVNGSNQVTVNATLNGCVNNDFVTFPSGITYNGVTISGSYQVNSVGPNSYVITASTNASDTGTDVLSGYYVQYQINTGTATAVPILGWGAGGWGSGTWGNGGTSAQQLQLWSQANFGENLVFGPRGGGMYYWVASSGVANIAYSLTQVYGGSDVPIIQNNIVISDASRFVLALGCNDYGQTSLSPMLIRWSDQESVSQWTPKTTNQAGSLTLSHGSTIVGAIQSRQEIVVFTDSSVYSLQYLGPPAVWGSTLVGENTSILSPNAMSLASGVVYWMGNGKFYTYNGTVQTLNCDLREFIFSNINLQQSYQIFSGTNEAFNEVWWFYCSANSTQIDTYVIYNYLDNAWYFGYLGRTAWSDIGLNSYPIAATYINNLVYHEYGTDDNSTSVSKPIDSYIQSSEFDIEDGDRFSFVWQLLPDVRFNGSTVNTPQVTMSLYGLQNSGSGLNSPSIYAAGTNTATVAQSQKYVPASGSSSIVTIEMFTGTAPVRVRGRQLIFRIEGNQLGLQWQLGAPRINIRADGRRGDT
jgi:hypothetical protein